MDHEEDAKATLQDLDADLARYDASEDGQLKKIAAFSRIALYLHEGTSADERQQVNALLRALALKHDVPEACMPT